MIQPITLIQDGQLIASNSRHELYAYVNPETNIKNFYLLDQNKKITYLPAKQSLREYLDPETTQRSPAPDILFPQHVIKLSEKWTSTKVTSHFRTGLVHFILITNPTKLEVNLKITQGTLWPKLSTKAQLKL